MAIQVKPVVGYADLERWVAVRNEVAPDDPDDPAMIALVRASEIGHVNLLAYEDGEAVGTGMLAADPTSLESSHPYVEVMVPARNRGRGVGTALLRELSDHVRGLGKEGLHVEARADDDYSLQFMERRGFVEVSRLPKLVLALAGHEPAPREPVDGVEVVWLTDRHDLVPAAYAVAERTYPELGGAKSKQASTLHEWQVYELGDPRLILDLTALALANGEVVGFATLIRIDEGSIAEHRMTTVLPEWRRRGVGTALTQAQIAGAKAASFQELLVWARSDAHRRLFEKLGFEERSASVDLHGPLL
jgi:N-acetylglutamate synthase-like GNAT family acetyltransferase